MQLLTPLFVMMRTRTLTRQFRDIKQQVIDLPRRSQERLGMLTLREIGQASRNDFPHLYGTPADARYSPWGQGTDIGYERACSGNTEVSLRGMALWLAVAFHETKATEHASLRSLNRDLAQLLRELKEVHSRANPADDLTQTSAVA